MTTLTHILVDFENVQPGAADIALLHGEGLRLAIFRGPGQMKYAADLAEAWQPLGSSVQFIRCAKAGRNAVDMHIAFHLGALIDAHKLGAGNDALRLVVVSRDTDFDPLLLYIREQLGYEAVRAISIKAALAAGGETQRAPRSRAAAGAASRKTAPPAAAKAPTAARTATKKAPAKKVAAARSSPAAVRPAPAPAPAPAPRTATRRKSAAPAAVATAADAITKVIDSLRHMGDKRPAKRAGLERHIESHLGRNLEPGALQALMTQLEHDGVFVFDQNKVTYHLPKARR